MRNIPEKFRTNGELKKFFQHCLSEDAVFESRIKAQLPDVAKLIQIRAQTLQNLEYAVSVKNETGERPRHKTKYRDKGTVEVDSIEGELLRSASCALHCRPNFLLFSIRL